MNAKLDAISTQLRKSCRGFSVRHEYVHRFHCFLLENGELAHWLYIPWELVRELTVQSIGRLIDRPDCIGRLSAAKQPICLCLLEIGARDVGKDFLPTSLEG